MQDYEKATKTLQRFINKTNIDSHSIFVPQSMSRNADSKYPSLNYICTLTKQGKPIKTVFDYMMGVGHAEKSKKYERFMREYDSPPSRFRYGQKLFCESDHGIKPKTIDLFTALLLDAGCAIDCDFDDFCTNLSYDTDSISAHKIFGECVDTLKQLRNAFGHKQTQKLIEIAWRM